MAMAPQGQAEHDHDHQHGHRSEPNSSHNDDTGAAATSRIATNRWGPYSGAGDFASNMAVILAALLTALALDAVVRFLLGRTRRARRGRAGSGSGGRERDRDRDRDISNPEKPALEAAPPPPAVVYSAAGTKLAGTAADCAICLAEFADGDAVRVMPACRHGFHARWLAGVRRSSCPTCRAPSRRPLLPPRPRSLRRRPPRRRRREWALR